MKTLVKLPQLDMVPYFDQPPALGGTRTDLRPEQFKEIFGCEYTESILISEGQDLAAIQQIDTTTLRPVDQKNLAQGVKERLQTPLASLAIGFINKDLGHGVFALEDIPAGTVLCLYAGELTNERQPPTNRYVHETSDRYKVSAQHFRGISGFMAHLPVDFNQVEQEMIAQLQDREFLATYLGCSRQKIDDAFSEGKLSDELMNKQAEDLLAADRAVNPEYKYLKFSSATVESSIATDNVDRVKTTIDGNPVVALIARRKICKNEIVGFTYTLKYWQGCQLTPELFSKLGQVVPHELYKRTDGILLNAYSSSSRQVARVTAPLATMLSSIAAKKSVEVGGECLSIYEVREQLYKANAVSNSFAAARPNPDYVDAMDRQWFSGKKITVKTFWQNPIARESQPEKLSSHTAEVVCQADDESGYQFLLTFFRPVQTHTKADAKTREVVISDFNDPKNEKIRDFIKDKAFLLRK